MTAILLVYNKINTSKITFTRFINENKLKHFSCSSKYMSVRRNGLDKDTDFS